jgi:hypothetical protein
LNEISYIILYNRISLGNPIYILNIKPFSKEKLSWILLSIIYLYKSNCFLAIQNQGDLVQEFYPNQHWVVSFESLSTEILYLRIFRSLDIGLIFELHMDHWHWLHGYFKLWSEDHMYLKLWVILNNTDQM